MKRLWALMMVAAFLLLAGPVACTGDRPLRDSAAVPPQGGEAAIFVMIGKDAKIEPDGRFRAACVGTFLGPGLAITAAHCLHGSERTLTVVCESGGGIWRRQTLDLTDQHQHPTADVTLLPFKASSCRTANLEIAAGLTAGDTFQFKGSNARTVNVEDASLDALTIRSESPNLCLPRGESGAQLYITADARAMLAGLLISGSPSCPGDYLFVRLDRLRDWIERARASAR